MQMSRARYFWPPMNELTLKLPQLRNVPKPFVLTPFLVGSLERREGYASISWSPVYEVFAPSYTKALKFMFTLGVLVFGVLPA